MAGVADDVRELERGLLMRGLGALEADRDSCADCGRTPLIGEQVHLYETSRTPALVCELCSQLRRGAPLASEIVRHSVHSVRIRSVTGQGRTAERPA